MKNQSIKKALIWLIVILMFITSCSKDPLEDNGKNFVGKWKYEKVKKRKKNGFFSSDVTVFYQNLILDIRSDNTFVIYRNNGGDRATGTWRVDYYITYTTTTVTHTDEDGVEWEEEIEEETYNYFIEGSIIEEQDGEMYDIYWESLSVTSNVMKFREDLGNEIFKYKLRRY